jgi:hypothetical protein
MTTLATPGTARRRGRIVHSAKSRSASGDTAAVPRRPTASTVVRTEASGETAGAIPGGSVVDASATRSITNCRAR